MRYFKCPDQQTQLIDECLKGNCRMNKRCKPLPFLMLAGDTREVVPGEFSVTQLLNGTMENYLKIAEDHDIVINPSDRTFAVLGTSAHSKLEQKNENIISSEVSMSYPIALGITLTGTADLIERQSNGELWLIDHKTSGSYKTGMAIGMSKYPVETGEFYKSGEKKGQPKTKNEYRINPDNINIDDWIRQVNMYRVMFEHKFKMKIDAVKIFNIVRDGGTIASKSRGIMENDYYIDIPLLPDGEIIDFYTEKAVELFGCIKNKTQPPTVCTAKERWDDMKCKRFCDVANHCKYGKKIKEIN